MAALVNASIEYESGQSQQPFAMMTDSSDHLTFSLSTKPWSQAAGYEYVIRPYGLATGGEITPAAAAGNNNVDVAALTAMMPGATGANATTGVLTVAAATNVAATRGTTNGYRITSITITNAGAIAAVAGTESTAFSETRGAAGGPPFIPVDSIEIGQVRLTSTVAAVVSASEIFQVVGTHQERSDSPVWSEDPIRGTITFAAALPLIHTGGVAKRVYARVATPIFAVIPHARNWKPAETSNSSSSQQYYDGVIGSFTSSLSQAGFDAALNDGITDTFQKKRGLNLLFRYRSDKNKTPYQITQGIPSIQRTFAAGANPTATIAISALQESVDFES